MENTDLHSNWTPILAALPRIARYRVLRPLGEGAFGVVVLAEDCELQRQVALKFIHPDRKRGAELVDEARTLASLEHPGLCRVFDVGHVEGRPYIAMQYLEGPTLEQAGPALLQRHGYLGALRVVRDIAQAIWFAHAHGVAHRDLKLTNVILTSGPEGAAMPTPVVFDFGLASPTGERTIAVPSDVWALGELLYVLLGGPSSAMGPSSLAMYSPMTPRPTLGSLGKDMPEVVDAVLAKALNPVPEQRYDSARAFALDLDRILEGRPTEALPVGSMGRMGLWIRRNPWTTGILIGTALLIGVVATAFIVQRQRAQARLFYTQRFSREAEQIEGLLYRAFAMPEGNSAAVIARVRKRMGELKKEEPAMPTVAQGPLAYALGRAHLALGDYGAAKTQFDRAAAMQFAGPELDYAKGLVSAQLFLQEMEGVDGKARERRLKRLEAEFPGLLQKTQTWLREGRQLSLSSPDLGAAFVSATEDRWDEALHLAREAQTQNPFAWEPLLFEGRIHRRMATLLLDQGQWDKLDQVFALWDAVVAKAEILGRSAPAVRLERMMLERLRSHAGTLRGDFSEERFLHLRKIGQSALALDPGDWRTLVSLCDAEEEQGNLLGAKDKDPRANYIAAIDYAERACRLRPEESQCWSSSGDVLDDLARAMKTPEVEKIPLWRRSLGAYRRAADLRPNSFAALNNLGATCNSFGEHLLDFSGNAREILPVGEQAFRHAMAIESQPIIESNLAWNLALQAKAEIHRGGDGSPLFKEAERSLEAARTRFPDFPNLYAKGGRLYQIEATWRMQGHGDPKPALAKAFEVYGLGIKKMPDNCEFGGQPIILRALEYAWRMRTGQDPESCFKLLDAEAEKYEAQHGCAEWKHPVRVAVAIARLQRDRSRGVWNEAEWRGAQKSLRAWDVIEPNSPEMYLNQARLAHAASGCGVPAARKTEFINQRETSLAKALAINPELRSEAEWIRKE